MTEENWIFIIIMTSVALFGIGLYIGNNVTTKLIRQDLCKAVYRNTNDYIKLYLDI